MSLLREKLERAGLKSEEAEFKVAIARFANRGGARSRAHDLVDECMPQDKSSTPFEKDTDVPASRSGSPEPRVTTPYKPRLKPQPEAIEAVRKKIVEIMFGYKMVDGRDLADVGAHELDGLERDGKLIAELKREMPVLTGNMRFANLRHILTADQVKAARERAGC